MTRWLSSGVVLMVDDDLRGTLRRIERLVAHEADPQRVIDGGTRQSISDELSALRGAGQP